MGKHTCRRNASVEALAAGQKQSRRVSRHMPYEEEGANSGEAGHAQRIPH